MPSSSSGPCDSSHITNNLSSTNSHSNVKPCSSMLYYPLTVASCSSSNKSVSNIDLDSSITTFSNIQLNNINSKMGCHYATSVPYTTAAYNIKSSCNAYSSLYDSLESYPAFMRLAESNSKFNNNTHSLITHQNPLISLSSLQSHSSMEDCQSSPVNNNSMSYIDRKIQSIKSMESPAQKQCLLVTENADKVDDVFLSTFNCCESVRSESSCSSLSADSHSGEQVAPQNRQRSFEKPCDISYGNPSYHMHHAESLLYQSMNSSFHNSSCITARHVSYFHQPLANPDKNVSNSLSKSDYIENSKQVNQKNNQNINVPFGWQRIICNGSVVYISPSNAYLRSLQDVCTYLSSNGTCKCGLQCPFKVDNLFNFNPKFASSIRRNTTLACRHTDASVLQTSSEIKKRKEFVENNNKSDIYPEINSNSSVKTKDVQRVPDSYASEPSKLVQTNPSFLENPNEYLAQQTALLQHHITLLSPPKDTSSNLFPTVQVLSQPVVQVVNPVVMPQTLNLQIVPGGILTSGDSCSSLSRNKRPKKRKASSQSVASLLQGGPQPSPLVFTPATTLLQPVNLIQNVPILLPSLSVMGTTLLSPLTTLSPTNTGLLLQVATPGQLLFNTSNPVPPQELRESSRNIFY